MKTGLNTIIFDAGGTLVGADNFIKGLAKLYNHEHITDKLIISHFTELQKKSEHQFMDVKGIINNLSKILALDYGIEDLSHQAIQLYIQTYTNSVYLYDGVLATLNKLKDKGVKIILVSDADADILIPQFTKLNIDHFFTKKIISSDVRAYKPSDRMVNYIKANIDLPKDGVLFVGDSIVDIETAGKLGCDSVFIGTDISNSASYNISMFNELEKLLSSNYSNMEN